ncbi:MAG: hypothetical protein NC200_08035, partial [Candidatus Gastranaerophilales bacterium]|nr:hypothetical protein [Candidatus Gastranaerophilales bacterium]
DTVSQPYMISYKEFFYGDNYMNADTIKSATPLVKTALSKGEWVKPANFRAPKPEMASARVVNADKTEFVYDEFGNVNAIYSTKGHKTRTITRDPKGNLMTYSDISYKNDKKSTERVFNDEGVLVETYKYHGDGTATVRTLNEKGKPEFECLMRTKTVDGEEVVTSGRWWDVE